VSLVVSVVARLISRNVIRQIAYSVFVKVLFVFPASLSNKKSFCPISRASTFVIPPGAKESYEKTKEKASQAGGWRDVLASGEFFRRFLKKMFSAIVSLRRVKKPDCQANSYNQPENASVACFLPTS